MAASPDVIRVLVIAAAGETSDRAMEVLAAETDIQVVGIASSGSQAIALAKEMEPSVILVDEAIGGAGAADLIHELALQCPAAAVIAMVPQGEVTSARRAMLAGARGFVSKPLNNSELPTTLRQIYQLELARRAQLAPELIPSATPAAMGRILALYSPKGGVGRTTIAANLAVALKTMTGRRVVAVDSKMQFGDLGLVLNLRSKNTLADLLSRIDELDVELISSVLVSHSSGLQALLTSPRIEVAGAMQPVHVQKILSCLQEMFDYIIVDTWPLLDDNTLTILDQAHRILVVITPEISSLHNVRLFLELADSLEYPAEKLSLVLNQYSNKSAIKLEAIEEHLQHEIFIQIPEDRPLVAYTINRGVPLVTSHRRSAVARSLFQLAKQVAEEDIATREVPRARRRSQPQGRLPRLRGLLRSP